MSWMNAGRWLLDLGWFVFLIVLFHHFWRDRQALLQAKSWLKAKGHITHCEWTEAGHSIWPKLEYSYQVYDKELVGTYLFLDTAHNNPNSKYARRIAYEAAMAFKNHQEIDVYYNPNNPEQSALDVMMPVKLTLIIGVIGGFIMSQALVLIHRLIVSS